jgi:heme/copper-type cytochrome/quinol oxidase subunit 2
MLSFFVLVPIFIVVIKLFKYIYIETHNTPNNKDINESIQFRESNYFDIFMIIFYVCIFFLLLTLAFIELLRKKR